MSRRRRPFELNRITTLQGQRLRLREPRLADAPAVHAYASDPEVTRYLAWPRHTCLADSERFLLEAAQGWQSGSSAVWLIEDREGVVGAIGAGLSRANAGIGYVLARDCWGRGYASEALAVTVDALFHCTPVTTLWAMCVSENLASQRVLEKGHFRFQRTLDNYFACPNLGGALTAVRLYARERAATGTGSRAGCDCRY